MTWRDGKQSRRQVLRGLGAGTVVLAAAGARSVAAAAAARCYIDSVRGDDARDGATPETALRSLAAAAKLDPPPRWIGLARGSRFEGVLKLSTGTEVEAYGEGPAPIIDAAAPLAADRWENLGDALWAYGARLSQVQGLLIDDRRVVGKKELAEADAPGSWAWKTGKLVLRSTANPAEAFGRILAINQSCVQIVGADRCRIRGVAALHGVHGFLGQRASGVSLAECTARNCARNGFYLADDVSGWTLTGCVSEDNGGAGFAFNYGAANSTVRDSQGNRNAIDGCQFSEGSGTGHALIGCVFNENAVAGVNCKEKKQKVTRCRMEANGEAGVIAQINTDVLEMTDCVLAGNNRADNGTMNLALEDHAKVISTRNIYIGSEGKTKPTVNVRLIGRTSFESVADCFIDRDPRQQTIATIRVHTAEPAALSLVHASIYNSVTRVGRVIDCRGATNLNLSVFNTAVAGASACLAYDAAAKVSSGHNCYHNANGGQIVEVSGATSRKVVAENLRGFAADMGVESGSIAADPRFVDPAALDLSLAADSPARGAGLAANAMADTLGQPFGARPNIGAVAATGDLRMRLAR
jgi:hypothetical protein